MEVDVAVRLPIAEHAAYVLPVAAGDLLEGLADHLDVHPVARVRLVDERLLPPLNSRLPHESRAGMEHEANVVRGSAVESVSVRSAGNLSFEFSDNVVRRHIAFLSLIL